MTQVQYKERMASLIACYRVRWGWRVSDERLKRAIRYVLGREPEPLSSHWRPDYEGPYAFPMRRIPYNLDAQLAWNYRWKTECASRWDERDGLYRLKDRHAPSR